MDKLLEEKLKPLIADATSKALGVKVDELTGDISAKVLQSPLFDCPIDTSVPFKKAKKRCKKVYLEKMLQLHLGNISEVARFAGTDRRTVHRLIKECKININKIKKDLIRPYDIKRANVSHAIEDVLDKYKQVFHPQKLESMYRNVDLLSENLIKELPEETPTLKQAEEHFERKFIKKALAENNNNITKTAKKIGLRYETLQRKIKALNISH